MMSIDYIECASIKNLECRLGTNSLLLAVCLHQYYTHLTLNILEKYMYLHDLNSKQSI